MMTNLINPNNLQAKHKKWLDPRFAGGKFYMPFLSGPGFTRGCRRVFKRASEAEAYGQRVRERWIRLYEAAISAMAEVEG